MSDISRRTFDPNKHYSEVVMQQGRVQLDADWNEQQAIIQHRLKAETWDIIGPEGVPLSAPGFWITFTPDRRDLLISPGHLYVDGMLCEESETTIHVTLETANSVHLDERDWMVDGRAFQKGQWVEFPHTDQHGPLYFQILAVDNTNQRLTFSQEWPGFSQWDENQRKAECEAQRRMRRIMSYTSQPDYPDAPLTRVDPATGLRELNLGEQHLFLVYLEVWQRPVTALDDSHICEVALGGPDTATRLQTFWQVKIEPVTEPDELKEPLKEKARVGKELEKLEKEHHRAEIEEHESRLKELDERIEATMQRHRCDHVPEEWEKLRTHLTGTLKATTYNADAGYQGSENQLYRVEIHAVDANKKPLIFKWARDNASHVAEATVFGGDGTIVEILSTGQGGILNFSPGRFVEVVSTQNIQPGALIKINEVNVEKNQLTLVAGVGKNGDVIHIRLWNDKYESIQAGKPVPLEDGIQVEFSDGTYKTGDYWLIPARTATRDIEWPFYKVEVADPGKFEVRRIPQLPHGIQHHYVHLACIHYHRGQEKHPYGTTHDNRRHFLPLPEPHHVIPAIHVVGINWMNDHTYRHADLKKGGLLHGGLKITFDARLDASHIERMAAAMIIAIETEVADGESKIMVIHRKFKFDEDDHHSIIWRWHKGDIPQREDEDTDRREDENSILFWFRQLLEKEFGHEGHPVRVRVTLKGHSIWSRHGDDYIYLDGQAFGLPAGEGHRIALNVEKEQHSGAGQRASDFESWFYIHWDEKEDKDDDDDDDEGKKDKPDDDKQDKKPKEEQPDEDHEDDAGVNSKDRGSDADTARPRSLFSRILSFISPPSGRS